MVIRNLRLRRGLYHRVWNLSISLLYPFLSREHPELWKSINFAAQIWELRYRITPANSSSTGTSLMTNICTLASRILILVTLPRITFPSLGSNDVSAVVCDCLMTDTVDKPFFVGIVDTGPRIEAWITLEWVTGRCVPEAGLYSVEGPNGWPGSAIVGSGGFCVNAIVSLDKSSKLFVDLRTTRFSLKAG